MAYAIREHTCSIRPYFEQQINAASSLERVRDLCEMEYPDCWVYVGGSHVAVHRFARSMSSDAIGNGPAIIDPRRMLLVS